MEKTCFKCLQSLPIDCFYKHAQMSDGHLGKCKECAKADAKAYQQQNATKIAAYDLARSKTAKRKQAAKAYLTTPHAKALRTLAKKASASRHPGRAAARTKLNRALKKGLLSAQPCFACGDVAEAHHPDYSAPLSVTWLCKKHHTEVHQIARDLNKK